MKCQLIKKLHVLKILNYVRAGILNSYFFLKMRMLGKLWAFFLLSFNILTDY